MKKNVVIAGIVFFILNFGALYIGSALMGEGPTGTWYQRLSKAPWTPPGWVFGAAWFTIMTLFSIALIRQYKLKWGSSWIVLYVAQLILNIGWNYIFFNQHLVLLSLVTILSLAIVVMVMAINLYKQNKLNGILLAPYVIWLGIASSLNTYIYLFN